MRRSHSDCQAHAHSHAHAADKAGEADNKRTSWNVAAATGLGGTKHSHCLAIIQSSEDRMLVDMADPRELSRWIVARARTCGTRTASDISTSAAASR